MRTVSTIALLGAVAGSLAQEVTGSLGNAAEYLHNPAGAAYQATLPANSPVQGSLVAVTNPNLGVDFAVSFSNLPKTGGPFLYHIHVAPVPADGNCTATLGHLDPWLRGETPACDPTHPETCQVGDLSGKYGVAGKGNMSTFSASYTDPYVSLTPGLGAFFGNRSFVIHFANKTRLACANFNWVGSQPASNLSSTGTASVTGKTSLAASMATSTATASGTAGSSKGNATASSSVAVSTTNAAALPSLPAPLLTLAVLLAGAAWLL